MNKLSALIMMGSLSLLTACSSTPDRGPGSAGKGDSEVTTDTAPGIGDKGANGEQVEVLPAGQGGDPSGQSIDGGKSLDQMSMVDVDTIYEPIIYFAYDQYELDEEGTKNVRYHADILVANPGKTLILNGHTDERGTSEYNLALGEKRAKAVAQAMMLFGVSENRINIVSYGEEQPEMTGSDEASWAKNRRVEIVITR